MAETQWLAAIRPMEAKLVEALPEGDQVTRDRLRGGAGLLRWRSDQAPRQCRIDQLQLRPSQLADRESGG